MNLYQCPLLFSRSLVYLQEFLVSYTLDILTRVVAVYTCHHIGQFLGFMNEYAFSNVVSLIPFPFPNIHQPQCYNYDQHPCTYARLHETMTISVYFGTRCTYFTSSRARFSHNLASYNVQRSYVHSNCGQLGATKYSNRILYARRVTAICPANNCWCFRKRVHSHKTRCNTRRGRTR